MGRVLMHIIPATGLCFILQIILHEVGHLIGGLLTGWRFLCLQIYKFVLKREGKRLKLIIVGDTGYKCIMYPKSINTNATHYTMGGCISNLIFAILGLIAVVIIPMSPVIWLYIWSFTAFGIGFFFMNGMASTKRVCNDKACYYLLKTDKHNKLCHNAQLIMAKHLMEGLTYKEIGEEVICLCPDIAENDIQAYQAVLEYYYYLDIKDHLKMGQTLNKIRDKKDISSEVLEIVELELIYVRLICEISLYIRSNHQNNHRRINSIRTRLAGDGEFTINVDWNDFYRHRKVGDIHTLRVKAVYDAYIQYVTKNKESGINALNEAIKLIDESNFVYPGEKKFCIRQLEEVKRIFNSDLHEKRKIEHVLYRSKLYIKEVEKNK